MNRFERALKRAFGFFISTDTGDYRVCCPFCKDDKYKLYVHLGKDRAHCFHCGYAARVSSVLRGKNFRLSGVRKEETRRAAAGLPHLRPLTKYGPLFLWEYALNRIPEYQIYKYRLSYTTSPRYNGRLILPVTKDYDIVYFQARATSSESAVKYLNPSRYEIKEGKSRVVFNLDGLNGNKDCVICEGIFSAMAIPDDRGVAILGNKMHRQQLAMLLKKKFRRYIVMLDPGVEDKSLLAVEMLLRAGVQHVALALLKGGDPADIPEEVLKEEIATAPRITFDTLLELKVAYYTRYVP